MREFIDVTGKTEEEAINKALAELRTDGTLTELAVKYFGNDISKK